jgi:hypothetical protein
MVATSFRVPFRTTSLLIFPNITGVEMLHAVIVRMVDLRGYGGTPLPAKSGTTPFNPTCFPARFLYNFMTGK